MRVVNAPREDEMKRPPTKAICYRMRARWNGNRTFAVRRLTVA